MKPESKFSPTAWMCAAILCCACAGNEGLSPETASEEGYGRVDLSLTAPAASRAASDYNTDDFKVTVKQFGIPVDGPRRLGETEKQAFPVGGGYTAYVEICTAAEAEQANGGWGRKHLVGESDEFRIHSNKTTPVTVKMTTYNASVCVLIDPSLKELYTRSCTVALSESGRSLVWTYDNAGAPTEDEPDYGQVAYFNLDENGNRTLFFTIKAEGEGVPPLEKTEEVTLTRARNSRLKLTSNPKGTLMIDFVTYKGYDTENNNVTIE